MQALIKGLDRLGIKYLKDEPMKAHTTMRVGGIADLVAFPSSVDQAEGVIKLAQDDRSNYMVMGNGSNIIFRDSGYRGLIIILGEDFSRIDVEGDVITAQAGAKLSRLSAVATGAGLSGLEFAHGIPGTVGGGVSMNAGAYGGELKNTLKSVVAYTKDGLKTLSKDDMAMGYRTSLALREGLVVLSAVFALEKDDKELIAERVASLDAKRREKQPLNLPSAGSVFKRPEGYFAGALIENAGLKGKSIGGAMVSEKHAGFIVNTGCATSDDVINLIALVKRRVFDTSGVNLECEVRIVGDR